MLHRPGSDESRAFLTEHEAQQLGRMLVEGADRAEGKGGGDRFGEMIAGLHLEAHRAGFGADAYLVLHRRGSHDGRWFLTPDEARQIARVLDLHCPRFLIDPMIDLRLAMEMRLRHVVRPAWVRAGMMLRCLRCGWSGQRNYQDPLTAGSFAGIVGQINGLHLEMPECSSAADEGMPKGQ